MPAKKQSEPKPASPPDADLIELEDLRARLKVVRDAALTDADKRILTDAERDPRTQR